MGAGPVYSNTINYVHAVKFSGSTTDYLKIADASYLNGTDYTIMVLEKRQAANAGFFLSTTNSSDVADNKLELGYASDGVIAHNQNSTNYTVSPKVSAYADSTDKARLFTFVQDSTGGKKTYINGILAAEDATNTAQLSGVTTLAIGKGYTGEIGEIAIFTKALTNESRKTVEDYLGKKWTRKLNRSSANTAATGGGSDSNPTCLNGIVTEGGCDNACSTSVVTGISTPTQVNDGASGTLTCNSAAGYSGSVTYNCSNGDLNPVGSCAVTACSITGVTGFNDKTGLAYAASATAISSPCQAGYAGSPTYTCTTAGAASITGSCTPITCSITGVSGFNNATGLAYAESATAISSPCQAGYSGSPTYTCTTSGAASISGSCTTTTCSITGVAGFNDKTGLAYAASATAISSPCQAGYSGSPTYTCTTSGAASISGSCTPTTCSITSVTGFSNKTGLAYATSATAISSPCQFGYTASSSPAPSYTCTSTGAATITGSCATITCTAAAGTGYSAKSGLAYATAGSGSFSCDAAGYSGTINYTCTSAGAATSLTGACSISPCTGGNVIDTTTVPGSTIHKFTSSGTLTCSTARSIQVLVVGGGGAGGGHPTGAARTGGGGSGRMIKISGFTTGSSSTNYTVTVGNGGNSTVQGYGGPGQLSSFVGTGITLSAAGGGGGGGWNTANGSGGGSGGGGHCGGSGGGASSGTISGTMTTVTNAGNSGGNTSSCSVGGGGGGGAGGAGTAGGGTGGAAGGSGISDSITGSSVIYAAGGGGSGSSGGAGGSSGVGGSGSNDSGSGAGAGTANTGSGGGGAVSNAVSGAGGKGVVIVRY